MISLAHKIPPPVVGALVGVAMWYAATIGPSWAMNETLRYALVSLFLVAGLSVDLLGLLAFRASKTTINPLKPQTASALVIGGVYRYTRNPMYVGMFFLLIAWAVYLAALLPFIGPFVFMGYITRFQILPEERVLARMFGEQYRQYAARVRRWL